MPHRLSNQLETNIKEIIKMSDIKSEAMALIEKMPEDTSLEDIIEALIFKMSVEDGIRQVENGEFITNEEAMERIDKWIIK
jgi:predicted transcriptional regulator